MLDGGGEASAVKLSQLGQRDRRLAGTQEERGGFDEFFGRQWTRVEHHLGRSEMSAPAL